jgi:hypothetical protein
MNKTLIMKSLPLVASVLGRKYGVRVEIGAKGAFTDGKTICLPVLPLDCDDTLIGLARGYIDHEAAHIRETRFDWLKLANLSPLEMHIWNTFEDWRVENALARLFPGCRQNFTWLIQHLFGNDTEQATDPAISILNWLLLSVRAWDVPSLGPQRDALGQVVEHHYPGLIARLNFILRKVRSYCVSTQECILYAREVASVLKDVTRGNSPSQPRQNKGEKSGETAEMEPAGLHPLDGVSDESSQALERILAAQPDDLPKGMGEVLADALERQKPSDCARHLTVARLGQRTAKEMSAEELEEAARASTGLRTRLHGLVQATVLTRCRIGRHGRLDPNRLHRLATADPRMFRKEGERQGIDTAVHILLDCSSSMRRRMTLAIQACHVVVSALDAVQGMNVAVTAFPAGEPADGYGTAGCPTVRPLLRHGERMHTRLVMNATGCTPMGEALLWVLQEMLPLTQERKIILILTDGDPDHVPITLEAIESGQRLGFEIYGLGINAEAIIKLLPHHSRVVRELPELAPAMFGLLQGALLGR